MSLLRALWKRKLLAGLVWLIGTAAVVTVVQHLPAIYRAETLVLVESQRAREESVKANAEAQLQDLLSTQRQQILSYQRLLEIVHKFDLYRDERQRYAEGDIIAMMRHDIEVTLDRGWSRDRPGAFRIAYQGRDPNIVARVANQLGSLFIEENSRTGGVRTADASEFLDGQVQEARRRLQDQESKLSEFKLKYSGQLPQQENALLADLGRLQVQLQGVQDAVNRTQQNKVLAETMLAAAQQAESSVAEIANKPQAASGDPFEETAKKEAERLQKQLDTLRLRYTEEHPEIRHTRQLLAQVQNWRQKGVPDGQTQAAKGDGAAPPTAESASGTVSQPLLREKERVESLKAQRALAANQLEALDAERKRVVEQIGSVQAGISKLPVREQELIALNRDYEIAKANYQFLLDKRLATQVTTEMEKRQKPDSFSMLEPARAPERPLKPNRGLLNALGTVVALFLGVGVGLGSEFRRGVVLGEWEIPENVVILGRVPTIRKTPSGGHENGSSRRLLRRLILGSVALLLAAGAVGVSIYFRWIPI